MVNENVQLKTKTVKGFFWKFAERMSAQLVSLVVSIILARLLTPDDYSVVGIVAIFFAFANAFISGGFNTALIQKKDSDEEDFSSVLFISLSAATVLYIAVFFCAPYIASAYQKDILIPVFRIMGLTLFINGFKSILSAYISSRLLFKKYFICTLLGTIVSAIVGISMAYSGYGPWALVAQQMSMAIISTLSLYLTTKVKFVLRFNTKKAKGLFNYSWKILVATQISILYEEINPLVIGLKYSGADLSYYTKGKSFPGIANSTIGDTLSAVLFPTMSKLQESKSALLNCTRRFMSLSSYVIFPVMIGFLAVADKFILVLLTEKWISATIYIQAFCIVYMFNIIQSGNLQVYRAVGRSDLILKLEVIKKSIYFVNILLFVLFTNRPEYLALACIINTFVATAVNTAPNRKLINYRYRLQVADLLPNLITAILMGVGVYFIGLIKLHVIISFTLQILSGVLIYVLLSFITQNKNFKYLLNMVKGFLERKSKGEDVNV